MNKLLQYLASGHMPPPVVASTPVARKRTFFRGAVTGKWVELRNEGVARLLASEMSEGEAMLVVEVPNAHG